MIGLPGSPHAQTASSPRTDARAHSERVVNQEPSSAWDQANPSGVGGASTSYRLAGAEARPGAWLSDILPDTSSRGRPRASDGPAWVSHPQGSSSPLSSGWAASPLARQQPSPADRTGLALPSRQVRCVHGQHRVEPHDRGPAPSQPQAQPAPASSGFVASDAGPSVSPPRGWAARLHGPGSAGLEECGPAVLLHDARLFGAAPARPLRAQGAVARP